MRLIFLTISFLASFAAATALSSGTIDEDSSVVDALASRDVETLDLAARESLPIPEDVATPTKRQHTNAHRLRNGLPLLPPTKRTRRFGALRPRTSCLPLTNNVGTIAVTDVSSNTVTGFITEDEFHAYTIRPADSAVNFSLPSVTPFGSAIDITDLNRPGDPYKLVGPISQHVLASGSFRFAIFGGVSHSDANSPPSDAGNDDVILAYLSESQVWTIDCVTLEITAQWTNPDHSQPVTQIFYFDNGNVEFIGFTGDQGAVQAGIGNTYLAKLTFVPNPT